MAEYIVEYPDDLIAEGYAEECINIHEHIVRCRDCKHFNYIDKVCDRYGEYPSSVGCWFAVNHNGFCAWGERRQDA